MDERMHETITHEGAVHRVDEREVRLAMDRLELSDRTLNVYRATAFLTALGVTVSHDHPADPAPATTTSPTRRPVTWRTSWRSRGGSVTAIPP